MIKLQEKFTKNADQTGDMNFEQVRRTDRVAMFKRSYLDGRDHSYEVFEVMTVKAGAKLPNGEVVPEDYEKYVTANSRPGTAFFCRDEVAADARFKELVVKIGARTEDTTLALVTDGDVGFPVGKLIEVVGSMVEVKPKGRPGRPATPRPDVQFPTTEQWTMKDLLGLNSAWTQPLLYFKLKDAIKNGILSEVGQIASGRGKPAKIYAIKKG